MHTMTWLEGGREMEDQLARRVAEGAFKSIKLHPPPALTTLTYIPTRALWCGYSYLRCGHGSGISPGCKGSAAAPPRGSPAMVRGGTSTMVVAQSEPNRAQCSTAMATAAADRRSRKNRGGGATPHDGSMAA